MTPPTDHDGCGGVNANSIGQEWIPATAGELRAFAAHLVNKPCWGALVNASDSSSCLIRLDFGGRHERVDPDPTVTSEVEQYRFNGEYVLWKTYAPWRLDSLRNESVFVTSFDAETDPGRITHALNELIGRKVTRIEFREPGVDCAIRFDDAFALKLFPTIITPGYPNYRLWSHGTSYSVDAYSSLVVRKFGFID